MKHLHITVAILFLLPIVAIAQSSRLYSHSDSLRAKAYWDSSWHHNTFSPKHQLYLDSALMVIPTNAYYWQQKAMPLYKAEKHQLGKPFLDSAVKYDASRWLEYRAFMKCMYEKDYRGALADFYNAKAMYGNRPVMDHPYNFFIAICHLQLNSLDSSKLYLQGCIDESTKKLGADWVHPNHLFYMGIVLYEQEEYKKAIASFDKAIKMYPQFSDAYYYKAICYSRQHLHKEALASVEMADTYFKEGYTINEDNVMHVPHPYQLRKFYLNGLLKSLREKAAKK